MAATMTNPLQTKGPNKNRYAVEECAFSSIRAVFLNNHYKAEHMGGSISHCFALVDAESLVVVGGAVYGAPRHAVYGDNVLDLRRFALEEDCPPNSESFFLAKTIKALGKKYKGLKVLTFADETQGHQGTIYQACNFKKIGETPPSKYVVWKGKQYHMRSMTIERPYSHALRAAVASGEAQIVRGLRKHKYLYDTADKGRSR